MSQQINEVANIELSNNVISLWKENDKSKYTELIKELEGSDELVTFLCRYQKDRWTAGSIDYIEITESPDQLHISYTINLFSGCKDLDKEDDDHIILNYKINLESCEIEITGEPVPEERSTSDEF